MGCTEILILREKPFFSYLWSSRVETLCNRLSINTWINSLYHLFYYLAVWNQYDDAVFPPASWFQYIRNKMPILKSMDPTEGRNIATWAMLPRWRGFLSETEDTNMSAWDAVLAIRDLAYCMTQSLMEEGGRVYENIPAYYSFARVSERLFYLRQAINYVFTIFCFHQSSWSASLYFRVTFEFPFNLWRVF